jgi:hypothetical protein
MTPRFYMIVAFITTVFLFIAGSAALFYFLYDSEWLILTLAGYALMSMGFLLVKLNLIKRLIASGRKANP